MEYSWTGYVLYFCYCFLDCYCCSSAVNFENVQQHWVESILKENFDSHTEKFLQFWFVLKFCQDEKSSSLWICSQKIQSVLAASAILLPVGKLSHTSATFLFLFCFNMTFNLGKSFKVHKWTVFLWKILTCSRACLSYVFAAIGNSIKIC